MFSIIRICMYTIRKLILAKHTPYHDRLNWFHTYKFNPIYHRITLASAMIIPRRYFFLNSYTRVSHFAKYFNICIRIGKRISENGCMTSAKPLIKFGVIRKLIQLKTLILVPWAFFSFFYWWKIRHEDWLIVHERTPFLCLSV